MVIQRLETFLRGGGGPETGGHNCTPVLGKSNRNTSRDTSARDASRAGGNEVKRRNQQYWLTASASQCLPIPQRVPAGEPALAAPPVLGSAPLAEVRLLLSASPTSTLPTSFPSLLKGAEPQAVAPPLLSPAA